MSLTSALATRNLGSRVRAVVDIDYVDAAITIEKGRVGAIQLVIGGGALVGVQWDGDELVARATFLDFLELASEMPAAGPHLWHDGAA